MVRYRQAFFLVLLATFLAAISMADTPVSMGADPAALPEWFAPVMNLISGIPYVGPWLLEALKYAGIVSTIFTALSTFLLGVSSSLVGIAKAQGFANFAKEVQAVHDTIFPWLAWFSMYNVQKTTAQATPPSASPKS